MRASTVGCILLTPFVAIIVGGAASANPEVDANQTMSTIEISGETLELSAEYVSIHDLDEIAKLRQFQHLRSVCFAYSHLTDEGLAEVCAVATVESLNLQGTKITDEGLRHLRKLPRLRSLRLKENWQLTNACIPHLACLTHLDDLGIHDTSIDQAGLSQLAEMRSLTDVCITIDDGNYTHEGLRELSRRMPWCRILAKGVGDFTDGEGP